MLRFWFLSWYGATFGMAIVLAAVSLWCYPRIGSLFSRVTKSSPLLPPAAPVYRTAPTVEKLRSLAELVSLQVQVTDILTVDQDGWLSGYKGAWLIAGDALWTTDLEQARLQDISTPSGHPRVRIELPRPRVQWARLDHERTRTYDLRSKSWIPLRGVSNEVRDEALRRAQQLVERTATHEKYRRQAERKTEETLARFFVGENFTCEVVWQPTPATSHDTPLR